MINCSGDFFAGILSKLKEMDYTGYAEQYPPFGSWRELANGDFIVKEAWKKTLKNGGEFGLFVNIPFCRTKCSFCFLPVVGTGRDPARIKKNFELYFKCLGVEAGLLRPFFGNTLFGTFYVGGGTPSLMSPAEIRKFFSLIKANFKFARAAQTVVEVHPDDITPEKLAAFKECGTTRLCLGVQSLSDKVLSEVRRKQRMESVISACKLARQAGIQGLNIDLICGLPRQTEQDFFGDLKIITALKPDQIHLNTFIATPYTIYAMKGGKPINERKVEKICEAGFERLRKSGYKRIDSDSMGLTAESRNFQTSDLKDKKSVLGLGPGAVSRAYANLRCINTVSWKKYTDTLKRGKLPVEKGVKLGLKDEMIYFIIESLNNAPRTLAFGEFKKIFGKDLREVFPAELEELRACGALINGLRIKALKTHWAITRMLFYRPEVMINYFRNAKK